MKKFITIAGNIGAGKSSLVYMLSQRLRWEPFFEPVANNPYLADFYEDMSKWGFHSQIYFLSHRLRVYSELSKCRSKSCRSPIWRRSPSARNRIFFIR